MNTLELFNSTPRLKQYVRDKHGAAFGVIVAEPIILGNTVVISIGMSLCHDSDKKRFDKKMAYELAANRAVTCEWHKIKNLPSRFHTDWRVGYGSTIRHMYDFANAFASRCQAYYKNLHVLNHRIEFI